VVEMEKVCKICKKGFISSNNRSIRCPKCQKEYRRMVKRRWARENLLKPGFEIRKNRRIRRKICIGGYKEPIGCLPISAKDPKQYWINKEGEIEDKHTLVRKGGNIPLYPSEERIFEWESRMKHLRSYKSPEEEGREWIKKYVRRTKREERKKKKRISNCLNYLYIV
jgi:hypothetical protein